LRALAAPSLFAIVLLPLAQAQESPQKPAEKTAAKDSAPTEPKNPAQIELLETKVRFEANGDSRKEVHTRVRINSELGVRQFARLNFDYNRSFQSIDIPLVRITHPSGGTADILPSAITDNPNPAVLNAPAYQDVRVKSVRILGLAPDDTLEYRIITTTSHHPLAPDFWLDHSFDRTGVVTREIFELNIPASPQAKLKINPETPPASSSSEEQDNNTRVTYSWDRNQPARAISAEQPESSIADVFLSTFKSWDQLADRLAALLIPTLEEGSATDKKAFAIPNLDVVDGEMDAVYEFVSKKIRTVDIPLGATGYRRRKPIEIFDSGYGSAEDKFALFAALLGGAHMGFVSESTRHIADEPASPTRFFHLLTGKYQVGGYYWLDLNIEVAPRGMIPSEFRNKPIFVVERDAKPHWQTASIPLRYKSAQTVNVSATLDADGKLTAKVHYSLRGDNELLLRVAFHKAPQEKWKDLAQLLSLSDGFRGKVTSVTASDPSATREPFTVDYEITMPKFVDWSKKPVRIPALLPQLGLPDPPAKPAPGAAVSPIELGTPLEVETHMTLHLPPGTTAQTPTGTSVQRDYATYASQYSAKGLVITASRHINFLLREVPAERAADYNAFLRAVQSDEAQDFTLDRPEGATAKSAPQGEKPATPKP
jgi:hypothetical protein